MTKEITAKDVKFLAKYIKKIEEINKRQEYRITVNFDAGNRIRVWAKTPALAQAAASATRLLKGSQIEVLFLWGGTSDRPLQRWDCFTPGSWFRRELLDYPCAPQFLAAAKQILIDVQGAPNADDLIVVEEDLIRIRCLNRFVRDAIAEKYIELGVHQQTNFRLLIEIDGEPTFDVIESNRILVAFLEKVQALNACAERPVSIKKMPHDIFQIWASDAYTAQDIVNLCRDLYGCGIGLRIVYGGTSDCPWLLYDEFTPGFFLRK